MVGARQHNLVGIDLVIPKGKLVVLTGPSGCGKSSLAFHTLYAEGQRRYVESLSTYARQFLEQLEKPDVAYITGLSPSIAIEQGGHSANPRSTVATVSEVYDFLRVLYAAAGVPYEPVSGRRLERLSSDEILQRLMSLGDGTKLILLAPIDKAMLLRGEVFFNELQRQGFVRVRIGGEIVDLDEGFADLADKFLGSGDLPEFEVVVDRLVLRPAIASRLADSIETGRRLCDEEVRVLTLGVGEEEWNELSFVTRYYDRETGFVMGDFTPQHFSFNSLLGACRACHGRGVELFGDEKLIVPDEGVSLANGAVKHWWQKAPKRRVEFLNKIDALRRSYGESDAVPFRDLSDEFKRALFYGVGEEPPQRGIASSATLNFEGLCWEAERLYGEVKVESQRKRIRRFLSERSCSVCEGKRLREEILAIKLQGTGSALGIYEFCQMPVARALEWLKGLEVESQRRGAVERVVEELTQRLGFIVEVGLGYLGLNRETGTLSGGEGQRIRLATQLGSDLSGVLYVLDEPSVGLHPQDNQRLIKALKRLRDLGNSVLVVEHDEDIIRNADWVIDMGPGAGPQGGRVLAEGRPADIQSNPDSPTGRWLSGAAVMPTGKVEGTKESQSGESQNAQILEFKGISENNLCELDVEFPLGKLVCLTGPSGSGKSTLAESVIYEKLRGVLTRRSRNIDEVDSIMRGYDGLDRVVFVNQKPLGKSPRSNAATYSGAFDIIRNLFAGLPLARQRGYGPARFSFNLPGGRCEKCQGAGFLKIDMHFLTDAFVRCDACSGTRYKRESLEPSYRGRNIAEVLSMSIEEASEFFDKIPRLSAILTSLLEVGLGYLTLGQAANTLSGGEAQRVKLAAELAKGQAGKALFIMDEPTTGLHFEDVGVLLRALFKLRDRGHSLLVVEHHPAVIRAADWVLELGPGGGEAGGRLVFSGPPEQMVQCPTSVGKNWIYPSR